MKKTVALLLGLTLSMSSLAANPLSNTPQAQGSLTLHAEIVDPPCAVVAYRSGADLSVLDVHVNACNTKSVHPFVSVAGDTTKSAQLTRTPDGAKVTTATSVDGRVNVLVEYP